MAMDKLSFGNIVLANSGKKGILKPNEAGLYPLNAGGFNIPNHAGIRYPANDYIVEQMEANSDLQRRVKMGYCKMEVEHPEPFIYVMENGVKYRQPITDLLQWINRLRSYDPDNICGLIAGIDFIFDRPGDVRAPIYNIIHCKPFGPKGSQFAESLATPEHNTAVSIRTQISPFRPGETQKNVEYWTGYDWVAEPGMIHANKHMTAGCESFLSDFGLTDNMQQFKVADVIEKLDEAVRTASANSEALLRVGGMEALDHFSGMLAQIKATHQLGAKANIGASFMDIF